MAATGGYGSCAGASDGRVKEAQTKAARTSVRRFMKSPGERWRRDTMARRRPSCQAGLRRSVDKGPAPARTGGRDRRGRDRKRVVEGKSVSVRVDLGGRRRIKKNNEKK